MSFDKNLLLHWWHHYGNSIYTVEDLLKFEDVIQKYGTDKVLEFAVANYIFFDGSITILLNCIREDNVENLFATLPNIEKMEKEEKEFFNVMKKDFIEKLTKTYNM